MGAIDYWCNAFTPSKRADWEAAIAAQDPGRFRRGGKIARCNALQRYQPAAQHRLTIDHSVGRGWGGSRDAVPGIQQLTGLSVYRCAFDAGSTNIDSKNVHFKRL